MRRSTTHDHVTHCPTREQLIELQEARLSDSDLERIAKHLETDCPRCLAGLGEIEHHEDPLIEVLKKKNGLLISELEAVESSQWVRERLRSPHGPLPSTVTIPRPQV